MSVQYGSLSGWIASTPNSVAGIKSEPNQVVNRTTSISRGSVTLCSSLYLYHWHTSVPLDRVNSFSLPLVKAGLVNLSSKVLRSDLSVLPVLTGIKRPYHASPKVKMKLFFLILFRLICVPVIRMAQGVTCKFSRDVNFSQYKT